MFDRRNIRRIYLNITGKAKDFLLSDKSREFFVFLFFFFMAGIAVFLCMSSLSLGNFGGAKEIGIILIGSIFAVVSSPAVFIAISGMGAVVFIAAASVETAVIAAILFFLLFVF